MAAQAECKKGKGNGQKAYIYTSWVYLLLKNLTCKKYYLWNECIFQAPADTGLSATYIMQEYPILNPTLHT